MFSGKSRLVNHTPIYLQNRHSPRKVTWNLNRGRGDSLCKPSFLGFHVKFGGEYDISSWNSQHSPFTSSFWEARPPYTRGSPWLVGDDLKILLALWWVMPPLRPRLGTMPLKFANPTVPGDRQRPRIPRFLGAPYSTNLWFWGFLTSLAPDFLATIIAPFEPFFWGEANGHKFLEVFDG